MNRSHVIKIGFFLRINSHESIRANRPDSRCESPGHLRYVKPAFFLSSGTKRKKSPKREFSGRISCARPGVIRVDVPDQKLETLRKALRCGHP